LREGSNAIDEAIELAIAKGCYHLILKTAELSDEELDQRSKTILRFGFELLDGLEE